MSAPLAPSQLFLLKRQVFKLIGSNFRIYDSGGNLVVFCHQKGFKLREDITLYADEAMQRPWIGIKARTIMDFSAAYDVVDLTTNEKLGAYKRKGWTSIIRDEWIVMDANDNEIGRITEDNQALALVRRFLTALIPQNFDLRLNNGQRVVDLRQRFNPFVYNLEIDFRENTNNAFDMRMGFAAASLIAAIEGRQSGG